MRVLQLISSNGFYGAEAMVTLLSTHLVEIGCEVTMGIFQAPDTTESALEAAAEKNLLPVWHLACAGRFDPWTVVRLLRFLRSEQIDVLHTHGYKADLYGLLAARLASCTLVATCHNWTDRTAILQRYSSLDKFLLRWFDRVVAVSASVTANLAQAGVPTTKLCMIHNGIDTEQYFEKIPQVWSGRPIVLGTTARLSREKGIDVLIRALPSIVKQYPDLLCVVVGEGPERIPLLTLAEELGVTRNLLLPGFQKQIATFLAGCSVIVLPSRKEGLPLAILEAMAAAKPIVASAVGGIPALLGDAGAGMLVPAGDSEALAGGVLCLLADAELRARYAANAAAYVRKHFEARPMARSYLEIYGELSEALIPQPTSPMSA